MNQHSHGNGNAASDSRQLAIRTPPSRNQLAALAGAFKIDDVSGLLSTVLNTGQVDAMQVGTALANNTTLDDVLKHTAAYRHCSPITPSSDFNMLSIGSSQEAAAGLRRITAGFLEARSALARNYDEQNEQLCSAFEIVNASYALVISTVHQLFDNDDPSYRTALRPEFLKLLSHDPYLEKLTPSFRDLLGATSDKATKYALRTFFENFCENAVEPYVYSADFSALIQSILLRELRHVIVEESKQPVENRKLAPYLASLFELRMRGELNTAQTGDGKPQPVLESLRRCPGESKYLMRSIANFLLESLGNESDGIKLNHKDVISCEVMLSVGCLLPETKLTELLGARLTQVDDMDASLVLVFSSALKFSLYSDPPYAQIDPAGLIAVCLKRAAELSAPERERMLGEVFLPLADNFIEVVSESRKEWDKLPKDFRSDCIDKVVLQKILKSDQAEKSGLPQEQSLILKQISDLLCDHLSGGAALDTSGLRWLVQRGAQGLLDEKQLKQVIQSTLGKGEEAARLGIDPEIYEQLLTQGKFTTFELLAKRPGSEQRLCNLICSYNPEDLSERDKIRAAFNKRLVEPLRVALAAYADAVAARRTSEMDSMQADDNLHNLARTVLKLAELKKQIPALRADLEQNVEFLKNEKEYILTLAEIRKKQVKLDGLAGLSVKELVDMDMDGVPDTLKRNIAELQDKADKICARPFSLTQGITSVLPEFAGVQMSLARLQEMQKTKDTLSFFVDSAQGASDSAVNNIRSSLEQMAAQRLEITRLFSLVQRAADSTAMKGVDPQSLGLTREGSFDLLGNFCSISISLQMNAEKPLDQGRELRLALEQNVKESLKRAFRDSMSKEDSFLVLNELATLVKRQAPILLDWVRGDDSLPEFLSSKLINDIKNSSTAWLNHDRGWDESMHVPIINILSAMLDSKIVPIEVKTLALSACSSGVKHWVEREKVIREIEEQNKSLPAQDAKTVPDRVFQSRDFYLPWAATLSLSLGRSKSQAAVIQRITEHLALDAVSEAAIADPQNLKEIFIPLYRSIKRCGNDNLSVLNPLPLSCQQFLKAVEQRRDEFTSATRQQEEAIRQNAPKAPATEGISFEALSGPDRLSLPRASDYREDLKRLK